MSRFFNGLMTFSILALVAVGRWEATLAHDNDEFVIETPVTQFYAVDRNAHIRSGPRQSSRSLGVINGEARLKFIRRANRHYSEVEVVRPNGRTYRGYVFTNFLTAFSSEPFRDAVDDEGEIPDGHTEAATSVPGCPGGNCESQGVQGRATPPSDTGRLQALRDIRPFPGPFQNPLPGSLVTSRFGPRCDAVTGECANHRGIDLAAARGTPVLASRGGVVEEVQSGCEEAVSPRRRPAGRALVTNRSNGRRVSPFDRNCGGRYGNYIVINHGDGTRTRYAHLANACHFKVQEGQSIAQNEYIGCVGSTGRSTGPHLHFEIVTGGSSILTGTPINPSRRIRF